MARRILPVLFLFLFNSLNAQEQDSVKNFVVKSHVHGGLFLGYSGLADKQPALSFQVYYDMQIVPFLSVEASQAYVQTWNNVQGVDTLTKIGRGFFKTHVAAQFVYPKIPKNHVFKASMGPSIYYAFITRLFNEDSNIISVIPPSKGNIAAGIAGTIQYHYFTPKNISVGIVASWDYVFQKHNFFGNIIPGISVGARF